ncbi:MAG: hypothetical protein DRP47_07630 [Candidatus Zixiibacteriota bacterium]|nr:MAG: hypothetical protein DRP47_07630 [candidate division Zixibacteria bacterium]
MSFFRGSTQFPDPEKPVLPDEEQAVLKKVAKKVVERRMAVPAIVFLESVKPLNYIASQTLVFFEPIIQSIFSFKDYNAFRSALEKRESVEILIQHIEKLDSVFFAREKRLKKFLKTERKKWKWYQRWLGLFTPNVKIPDEVLNPPDESDSPPKEQ